MKNIQVDSSHGGARSGAGRKANTPNKRTAALQAHVAATGETPLDYLLSVMRNVGADEAQRIDCAKAAAPYVHSKLSSVDAKIDIDGKVTLTWEG